MNTLLSIFKTPLLLVLSTSFATWFSIKYVPAPMLFFWLVIAVAGDLFTGLLKSWSKGTSTRSVGLRKTIMKIGIYVLTIVGVIVLVNMIGLADKGNSIDLTYLIDFLLGFMVFIEIYSMFENISEAYPDSLLVKYLVAPIMKLLKGRLEKGQSIINPENQSV
jgi:hypothetical protein